MRAPLSKAGPVAAAWPASRVIAERLPRRPTEGYPLHSRPFSLQSVSRSFQYFLRSFQAWFRSLPWERALRDARRRIRRPSGLALGAAFGMVAVAGAVLAAVSAGASTSAVSAGASTGAVSVSDQDGAAQVRPAEASGHGGPAPSKHAGHTAAATAPKVSHQAVNHLAAPAAAAAPAAPAKPYLIYDSTTPTNIPAGQRVVATYDDGPHPTSSSLVTGRKTVMWISITGHDYGASVVDVEPGNATPAEAASWAWHKLKSSPDAVARIYTMLTEWPAVRAAVASFPAPMRARIHWWIANPTGQPHIVPGSDATQWYWGPNYDITTASPGF
jgi:hypothetical protein